MKNNKAKTKKKEPKGKGGVLMAIMIVSMLLLPATYVMISSWSSAQDMSPTPTPTPIPPYKPEWQIVIPFNASEADIIAINLTNDGWRVYSYSTCGACVWQKAQFGDSCEYLNIIECFDSNKTGIGEIPVTDECLALGLGGFPTWISPNGTLEIGAKNTTEMNELMEVYR